MSRWKHTTTLREGLGCGSLLLENVPWKMCICHRWLCLVDALNQRLKLPNWYTHNTPYACRCWMILIFIIGIAFVMRKCHVRCVQDNILPTIGRRHLRETQVFVDGASYCRCYVTKMIHTRHRLWMLTIGCCSILLSDVFSRCVETTSDVLRT